MAKPRDRELSPEEQQILDLINAHCPSRLTHLPADFNARFGATHSDGKYYFTDKPFLIEGAEKLLALGTRLGKFWFEPGVVKKFYSFNSHWPELHTLLDLAKCDYFQAVWKLPFQTIMLETNSQMEHRWRQPGLKKEFYQAITQEYYGLASYFHRLFRDRSITVILQNWEGDWMLRGIGAKWQPPAPDWRERCERMQRWFSARQAGINKARAEFAGKSKCVVAHAVEVNRVADAWKGIPTVTRNVLPGIEVDLISYSAYDGINSGDPLLFWRCLKEIREHAQTGSLFGPGAISIGEYGIPENDAPVGICKRYEQMLGVMLAFGVRFAAQWELYCNEFEGKPKIPPPTPVHDPKLMRGLWLVKPDGTLGVGGTLFHELWNRSRMAAK